MLVTSIHWPEAYISDKPEAYNNPFFKTVPVLKAFMWLRELSRSKVAGMNILVDDFFEVGIVKEI